MNVTSKYQRHAHQSQVFVFMLSALETFAIVTVVAGIYAPVLVCVEAPSRFSGYVVGLVYSGAW